MNDEREFLKGFIKWAQDNELIRAAVLTGSRTEPGREIDFLSDYDIELYVSDIRPFKSSDKWLERFGEVMICCPRLPESIFEGAGLTRLVYFCDYSRIDFQIRDKFDVIPDKYDDGYEVLVDKDGILSGLDEPTYGKHIIKKPSENEFLDKVNGFWWNSTYVAKYLYRDEIPFAMYMLDCRLRHDALHRMLEWHIGMENNWSVSVGNRGKYFKKLMNGEMWHKYKSTYCAVEKDAIWKAYFKLIELFRLAAVDIAKKSGFDYPYEKDEKVSKFLKKIKGVDNG